MFKKCNHSKKFDTTRGLCKKNDCHEIIVPLNDRAQYAGVLLIDGDYIKPNFNSTCTRHV